MDLNVRSVVIHATVICVNDMKEIVHMDVLKVSKDTSVFPQVFEILFSILEFIFLSVAIAKMDTHID
jgi:multidrug transporter EmrE-like cation transporter